MYIAMKGIVQNHGLTIFEFIYFVGRNWKSEWSSRWSDLLDMLMATECMHAAHLELRPIPDPTPAVFADVRTVLTEPSGSLLGAETVVQNFSTQLLMILQ